MRCQQSYESSQVGFHERMFAQWAAKVMALGYSVARLEEARNVTASNVCTNPLIASSLIPLRHLHLSTCKPMSPQTLNAHHKIPSWQVTHAAHPRPQLIQVLILTTAQPCCRCATAKACCAAGTSFACTLQALPPTSGRSAAPQQVSCQQSGPTAHGWKIDYTGFDNISATKRRCRGHRSCSCQALRGAATLRLCSSSGRTASTSLSVMQEQAGAGDARPLLAVCEGADGVRRAIRTS